MSNSIIHVENLGKEYYIGANSADTLREQLTHSLNRLVGRNQKEHQANQQQVWALKDINLDVQQGEVLGIVGHNGAGKSTLLKILSRITHPTTGKVVINGRVASLLEVGTGFHPELTGRENIFMNAAVLGMKRAETRRRFDEIVEFAEVSAFIDTPVKRYSSGMYMRLAFAVAAHLEPEILIVDEVLAVGDVAFQRKSLGKMSDVASHGRTVLFVSHNIGAVSSLCTRAVHLDHGQIAKIGDTQSVIEHYIGAENDSSGQRLFEPGECGNQRVNLDAIRIISNELTTPDVDIAKDITIEVDYSVLQSGIETYVSIQLYDKMGVGVFASANIPGANLIDDEWSGKLFPEGRYRTRCTIPANTLNDLVYQVNVILLTDGSRIEVRSDSAISFTVHDTGEMRKLFTGNWLGAVRPKLAWDTKALG